MAARSFKTRTGVGTDSMSPRAFGWLSDQLLEKIAGFMVVAEEKGVWPSQVSEALIHLIAKTSGGKRPIGIVAALPRLWARVRRKQVAVWREQNARDYNWMTKGRGARRAVWVQSVMEEAAKQRGLASGSVLIDLIKAFDHLLLAEVWKAAMQHNFPTNLLMLSLECSSFERRLVYRGAYSETTVSTHAAVLPGLEHSTDFMLLALMGPIDRLLQVHQGIHVFLIADDTKIGMLGSEKEVSEGLVAATENLILELEGMCMKVSRSQGSFKGKTVALSSSKKVATKIKKRMEDLGIGMCRSTRNLGVDFGGGAVKIKKKIQKSKWKSVQLRIPRTRALGGEAAGVIRTGLLPSVTYGVEVTGVTEGLLKGWRTMMARGYGKSEGRSVTARLALEGVDPGKEVVLEAIMGWVSAVWDDLLPIEWMRDAWMHAIKVVGMAAHPNSEVRGGGGALFAALRRINWTAPALDALRTSCGTLLYFGRDKVPHGAYAADPRAVRRWVCDEYEKAAAVQSQVARDINDLSGLRGYPRAKEYREDEAGAAVHGSTERERELAMSWRRARLEVNDGAIIPWYWPASTVIRKLRKKGAAKAAASLRACLEGGWVTQRRLWAEGRAESDKCRCGKAAGTLWHKLATCELSQENREAATVPKGLTELIGRGKAMVWDPLFSRGVPARPKWPEPPKDTRWWEAGAEGELEIATGDIYTDGSALGEHWRMVRAGWAAVAASKEGKVLWRMGGTCGEPHASILRAELKAVLEVLKIASAPVRIHVDNATVVKGFKEGKVWCTQSRRDGADIWRDIWMRMRDIGEGVEVVKVRAHTTWWDVIWGRITAKDQGGNDVADREAKRALKEALRLSPTAAVRAGIARAISWARWIAAYASGWVKDTEELERRRTGRRMGEVAGGVGLRTTLGHEIWDIKGNWVCRRCGRQSENEDVSRALKSSPCGGCAGGRAVAHATGNRNYIWNKHALTSACLQQQGARLVRRSNIPKAMIDSEKLGEMVGEYAERAKRAMSEDTRKHIEGVEASGRPGGSMSVAGAGGYRMPWEQDPQWLYLPHLKAEQSQEGIVGTETNLGREAAEAKLLGGHALRNTGPLVWCAKCGNFAHRRHGRGLKGNCNVVQRGARRVRLDRLHQGLHPMTGRRIDTG